MPQFLSQRYNPTVSLIMAIFWLGLYILVNLTSILYLGALAVSGISGLDFDLCMGTRYFFNHHHHRRDEGNWFYNVIQVFFLIIGGLATTFKSS